MIDETIHNRVLAITGPDVPQYMADELAAEWSEDKQQILRLTMELSRERRELRDLICRVGELLEDAKKRKYCD